MPGKYQRNFRTLKSSLYRYYISASQIYFITHFVTLTPSQVFLYCVIVAMSTLSSYAMSSSYGICALTILLTLWITAKATEIPGMMHD